MEQLTAGLWGPYSDRFVEGYEGRTACRNPVSFAVALYCGMGSGSLNALVKAFDTLHLVLGWNSSCTGEMLWGFQLAFDKSVVDDHFGSDIGEFTPLPRPPPVSAWARSSAALLSRPTEMQSTSENDFECFASTGVNTPWTYFQTWTSTQRSASNMRVEYAGLDLAIPFDLNKQPIVTGLRKAIRK
jgi:hypothetical protein